MLVDQDDADVLALLGEGIKGGLDGRRLGLAVDDQEVLLRVGRVGDMLRVPVFSSKCPCMRGNRPEGEEEHCVLHGPLVAAGGGAQLTPIPASRRPVTESYFPGAVSARVLGRLPQPEDDDVCPLPRRR